MKKQQLSAEEALAKIRSKRPAAKPISFFVQQLKLYELEMNPK
jgi:protein-tyrosine phosphatase